MHVRYSAQTARGLFKAVHSGASVNARLRGVSVAEAERVLARIWQRIEECGAEAPELRFDFGRDGHIDIAFSFPDPTLAILILGDLAAPCSPSLQAGIARTGREPGGYRAAAGLAARRLSPADWS